MRTCRDRSRKDSTPYRVEYERPEIEQYTVFVNTPLLESPGGGFGGDEGGLDEEDLDD